MAIEIIPAILPKNLADLVAHIESLQGAAKLVQVDAVDGVFAKHKSWPYRGRKTFAEFAKKEGGLPHWSEISYEFDLMINAPAEQARNFAEAGAARVVLHAKSPGAPQALAGLASLREEGERGVFGVGIALMPDAQPEELDMFEDDFDFVQVMGIARIGRQGEPLDHHALFLLERLRRRYPHLPLQVDGGVRLENARSLVAAGATHLVAGSSIFGTQDPVAAYKALYTEANAH